jgi:hypothetical protein
MTAALPPTHEISADAWPHWVGSTAVTAGALALPLVALLPPLGLVLALVALAVGVAGSWSHVGAARHVYRWAAGLGALACALLVVVVMAMVGGSSSTDSGTSTSVSTLPAAPAS